MAGFPHNYFMIRRDNRAGASRCLRRSPDEGCDANSDQLAAKSRARDSNRLISIGYQQNPRSRAGLR